MEPTESTPIVGVSPPREWRMVNILLLGFAFMFMFTAFQTGAMVQESVIVSAKDEPNSTFTGDGYTSLAIIYAVFAGSNWLAPSVVAVIGPKIGMIISGVLYALFIVSFLYPMTWSLYVASVMVGLAAPVIWTAQGNFLTINSDTDTIGRNSGIFWALLQCSLLFGNLYVYFAFKDAKLIKGVVHITSSTRITLYAVLGVTCMVGVLLLLFLRRPRQPSDDNAASVNASQSKSHTPVEGPVQALKNAFNLARTKRMLLLMVAFAYTGVELTFFSGVYGTSVGQNQGFGKGSKSLLGLVGMFIGVGEILGGASFGLMGKRTNKYGRDPIVILGFLVHMLSFYLIFVNLPDDSPIKDTAHPTYMVSLIGIAIFCAFLLGFGDSCFNTQIYSLLGSLYASDSAAAFAMYKFVQSLLAAAGFFYSKYLLLQWQLLILAVMNVFGTFCFLLVEWESNRISRSGFRQL